MKPETIEQGRALCRAKDLDGLMLWLKRSVLTLDQKLALDTFAKCFLCNDVEKALKMLATTDDYNVVAELGSGLLRLAVFALVVLGLLGGVAALFNFVF